MAERPAANQRARLRRIVPERIVPVTECPAAPSAERVQCAECEKVFSGGGVVIADRGGSGAGEIAVRYLYCDHCDHVQLWCEWLDADGRLSGIPVCERPDFIRDQDWITGFLERHPEAKGVVDVP